MFDITIGTCKIDFLTLKYYIELCDKVEFGELKFGDCFVYTNENIHYDELNYDYEIFIKVANDRAVRLYYMNQELYPCLVSMNEVCVSNSEIVAYLGHYEENFKRKSKLYDIITTAVAWILVLLILVCVVCIDIAVIKEVLNTYKLVGGIIVGILLVIVELFILWIICENVD